MIFSVDENAFNIPTQLDPGEQLEFCHDDGSIVMRNNWGHALLLGASEN